MWQGTEYQPGAEYQEDSQMPEIEKFYGDIMARFDKDWKAQEDTVNRQNAAMQRRVQATMGSMGSAVAGGYAGAMGQAVIDSQAKLQEARGDYDAARRQVMQDILGIKVEVGQAERERGLKAYEGREQRGLEAWGVGQELGQRAHEDYEGRTLEGWGIGQKLGAETHEGQQERLQDRDEIIQRLGLDAFEGEAGRKLQADIDGNRLKLSAYDSAAGRDLTAWQTKDNNKVRKLIADDILNYKKYEMDRGEWNDEKDQMMQQIGDQMMAWISEGHRPTEEEFYKLFPNATEDDWNFANLRVQASIESAETEEAGEEYEQEQAGRDTEEESTREAVVKGATSVIPGV
jgi:hypothetical protein